MTKNSFARLAAVAAVILLLASGSSFLLTKLKAQQAAGRISGEIDNSARSTLAGSRSPMAKAVNDAGRVPSSMPLQRMSLVFKRSASQETELQALIAAQQNPSSPLYHQWLTPDEFGRHFGMSDSDLAKVQSWLQEQGFSVDGVAHGRNRITFSGTAGQFQNAFGTELHYYNLNGKTHFAPASDLSVPSALANVVETVTNISTFRPQPRLRRPKANFTSGQSGHTFLNPKDVATIYDVNAAYTAGFNGAGQAIAVVGQTSVSVKDMENFQTATGLSVKDPTLILVPGSGNVAEFPGDESESDLDLEYSGGMAPGADIFFVYTGDNSSFNVFDSFTYAIDNDIAPIISDSYGLCETALGAANYNGLNSLLAQGASQGQSIITPSGDAGSPDCQGITVLSAAQQQAAAVDFPASSQYVTAMGGSEFPSSVVCNGSCTTAPAQYWQTNGSTDVISSALASGVPFPEQVWNDDAPPSGGNPAILSSGGGGISTLTPRPTWQTGVPGIPSGTFRLVPDISLTASPNNAGFLYCSSDPSTGITGSCSHGFRDSGNVNLTIAGGTSFDAPIFAGLVAIINQKEHSVGQGVVSSTLYTLASNASTYASAFHDITSGNNNCTAAGTALCPASASSATHYSAGPGYDMASGLGSIDFNHLLTAWPAQPGSTLAASKTTVSAATNSPVVGTGDTITITVAPNSGSGTPTGGVQLWVSAATEGGPPITQTLSLTSGSATYNFVSAAAAPYILRAIYSGDATFSGSTDTIAIGNQSFRVTGNNTTVTSGSSGSATITVDPQNGYTGSIAWTVTSSPPFTNGCFSLPNTNVPSNASVTATLSMNTSATACGGAAALAVPGNAAVATNGHRGSKLPLGLAFGGLLFAGVMAAGPRKLRGAAGMMLLAVLIVSLPACGGGSSTPPPPGNKNVAPGNYTVSVIGKDTSSSTISSTASFTVSVQ